MGDQIDTAGVSPLNLFAPPDQPFDDYRFASGFVVTHDANTDQISTLLAPTLLGITASDPHRRVLEARAAGTDSRLLVMAAATGAQITLGGAVMPFVKVAPVYGDRRLHAKFGVLQFQRPSGAAITRAFITSANLTRSGLTSNHEFVVFDDCKKSNKTHLAFDLIAAVRALRADLRRGDRRELNKILKTISGRVATDGQPTGRVRHSLDQVRDLTKLWAQDLLKQTDRVDKMTIVSPGFASATDAVSARGLDQILEAIEQVRIVTSTDAKGQPVFSSAALAKLDELNTSIEIPAVDEDPTQTPRRLHAKLLAAHMPSGRCEVLVGSANYTSRGLQGQNRELVLHTRLTSQQVEDLLGGISPFPSDAAPIDRDDAEPFEEMPAPTDDLSASFEIGPLGQPTQLRWEGTLTLDFRGEPPESIWLNAKSIAVQEQQSLTLDSDRAVLVVRYAGMEPREISVEVVPPSGDVRFWQQIGSGDDLSDEDYLLQVLFSDMRVAAARSVIPGPSTEADSSRSNEDRYSIPLEQRLVRLVRNRDQLDGQVPQARLEAAIRHYLQREGDEAIAVALTAVLRKRPTDHNQMLEALSQALDEFD